MTIIDAPNEDATLLDDDALIAAYLETGSHGTPGVATGSAPDEMQDWPTVTVRHINLAVDVGTLAWFRSNHADWRREIGYVLRAWVTVQAASD